jgi:hypothetical protein
MSNRQLSSQISVATVLPPAARTANATGSSVDLADFRSVAVEAIVGIITDGTHALTVEHSDDGSIWSAVPAASLQGSFSNLASNTVQEVGYIGNKRYVRVNSTATGATTGGLYSVVVLRGRPRSMPI